MMQGIQISNKSLGRHTNSVRWQLISITPDFLGKSSSSFIDMKTAECSASTLYSVNLVSNLYLCGKRPSFL